MVTNDEFDKIDESLINPAQELLQGSDLYLMALALGDNENAGDNYQMAVSLKLKNSLLNLKKETTRLKKSINISSWIMGIMTFLILILTGVIVWKGL
ncbi:hypothetical protein KAT24_00085 [Candidatus Pacearchaeota archaeon]|nr:hypothetical protein [Candidatus Pacearchaeota archaeon]